MYKVISMKVIRRYSNIFSNVVVQNHPIVASISARDITRSMVRVKSSNVWSYAINIDKDGDTTGDVYVQFKGTNGGPGDIYVYFDVPVVVFRKWISTPSKGRYFWRYIRNYFRYAKLTGDRKTKLPNGVNRI